MYEETGLTSNIIPRSEVRAKLECTPEAEEKRVSHERTNGKIVIGRRSE